MDTVDGLPSALVAAMNSLLRKNALTTFDIHGKSDNTVVVIRFSLPSSSEQTDPVPFHRGWRQRPPSALARDKRRTNLRNVVDNTFPMPGLFEPTPPRKTAVDCAPTDPSFSTPHSIDQDETDHNILPFPFEYGTNAKAVTQSETVSECVAGQTGHSDLDNGCRGSSGMEGVGSGRTEKVSGIDAQNQDRDRIEEKSIDFSKCPDVTEDIKEYVGSIKDKSLQRRLRDKLRNNDCRKVVLDTRLHKNHLLCESDDIVLGYDAKEKTAFHWFIKLDDDRKLATRERTMMDNLRKWHPPDRGKYTGKYISEATEEIRHAAGMVRFLLE